MNRNFKGIKTPPPSAKVLTLSDFDRLAFPRLLAAVLDGHNPNDIRETIATEHPAANCDLLFAHAQNLFERSAQKPYKAVLGWCMESTRDLYRKMTEVGDFDGALRAVKQLAALAETATTAEETKKDEMLTFDFPDNSQAIAKNQ
jgi:hypothetical protein